MLNQLVPILLFYFTYSIIITIIKNRNRRNTLKMLIDNDLISNGDNNINVKLIESDNKYDRSKLLLPIALGAMGLALGLVCGAFIIARLSIGEVAENKYTWFDIKDAIQIGAPLFFASIGVVVAYIVERCQQKSDIK